MSSDPSTKRPRPLRSKSTRKAPAPSANEVRIVGGAWRSRRIRFTPHETLRPTPDRVRETLFNWLGQDLTGLTCLDLFAGSGALGFEAASRGAKRVVMVERDRSAFATLQTNGETLEARQVELVRADALEFLRGDTTQYDVIFLDPPFSTNYWPKLLPLVAERLSPRGRVYYEAGAAPQWPPDWSVLKSGRAGQVIFQLVTWNARS